MSRFINFARLALSSLALTLMLGAAGCSDTVDVKPPPPSKTSSAAMTSDSLAKPTLTQFRNDLVQSQQQIDSILQSLTELTNPQQTDLRGAYNKYSDQVARMVQHSETIRRESEGMRSSREAYFGNWEERVTEIDNPTIRASAEARRQRLRAAHDSITNNALAARDAYDPFMKDLQDIRKYLSTDLSKSSIADLGDAVKKVRTDGSVVRDKIGQIVSVLDSVQGGS